MVNPKLAELVGRGGGGGGGGSRYGGEHFFNQYFFGGQNPQFEVAHLYIFLEGPIVMHSLLEFLLMSSCSGGGRGGGGRGGGRGRW